MSQTTRNRFSVSEKRILDKIAKLPPASRTEAVTAAMEKLSNRSRQSINQYIRRLDESSEPAVKKAAKKSPKALSTSEPTFPSGEIRFEIPIKRIEFQDGKLIIIAEHHK